MLANQSNNHLDTRSAHHVYYQKLCTVRVITQKRQKAHLKANSPRTITQKRQKAHLKANSPRTILYDYVEGGEKPP